MIRALGAFQERLRLLLRQALSHRNLKEQKMKREELIFHANYCFFIESMHARFLSRADKLLTFIQLVIGSSVFASVDSPMLLGGALVSFSALSFVWQPAVNATLFANRADQYARLLYREQKLSDEELNNELASCVQNSYSEIGLLCAPAYKRAAIKLGLLNDKKLTRSEALAAWFAGDLPR
jgi:hypothetical protein